MNKKRNLVKNTIIIFIGRVCTQLISFFLLPLYTGYLTTKDYGIVDLIITYVALLVPIITLELEMSIFRYLVDNRKDEDKKKRLLSNNYLILCISIVIFICLYFIFTSFIKVPFKYIILLDIIICVLSGNLLQIARGLGHTLDYAISCIITGATTIISNIILIVGYGYGAKGMILSMAIANGLGGLYLFIKLKIYKYINFKLKDKSLIKEMYNYSIPLVPNSISFWIISVSDRSIISYILGTALNGIYAVSNKFSTIIFSLTGIFNLSWNESITLHINSKDRDKFISETLNTVFRIFTSICIIMLTFMPFVFPILINHKYNSAYNQIPILVLAGLCNLILCLYSAIYIALKLTKKVSSVTVLGAIINIIINLLFIKKIGLYAASISTLISYFTMMLYRHIDLKKYVNIKIDKKLLLKTILLFVLIFIIYYKNNLILNILSLCIGLIYSICINKDTIISMYKIIIKKLKRN